MIFRTRSSTRIEDKYEDEDEAILEFETENPAVRGTARQVAAGKFSTISALCEYRQAGSMFYFTWENP